MPLKEEDLGLLLCLANPSAPDALLIDAYLKGIKTLDQIIRFLRWPEFTHGSKRRLINAGLLQTNGVTLTEKGMQNADVCARRYDQLRKGILISERKTFYPAEFYQDDLNNWLSVTVEHEGKTMLWCGNQHLLIRGKPNKEIVDILSVKDNGKIYEATIKKRMLQYLSTPRTEELRVVPELFQVVKPGTKKMIWFWPLVSRKIDMTKDDQEGWAFEGTDTGIPVNAIFYDFLVAKAKGLPLTFYAEGDRSPIHVMIKNQLWAFIMPMNKRDCIRPERMPS